MTLTLQHAEQGIPLDRELARQITELRAADAIGTYRDIYPMAWEVILASLVKDVCRLSYRPQPLDPTRVILNPRFYQSLRLADCPHSLQDPLMLNGKVLLDVHVHPDTQSMMDKPTC